MLLRRNASSIFLATDCDATVMDARTLLAGSAGGQCAIAPGQQPDNALLARVAKALGNGEAVEEDSAGRKKPARSMRMRLPNCRPGLPGSCVGRRASGIGHGESWRLTDR